MRRPVGDALHQPLLDLRERPLRDEQVGVDPPSSRSMIG